MVAIGQVILQYSLRTYCDPQVRYCLLFVLFILCACAGADAGVRKGGRGGPGNCNRVSTKKWRFRAHMRDIFPLFMKFGGPPKGGGGGGGSPPPPGSAPDVPTPSLTASNRSIQCSCPT